MFLKMHEFHGKCVKVGRAAWSINNAKFINRALVTFKIFEMVTTTTFPMKFDTKQT